MEITFENPDINNIDREIFGYIIEHNKKYDHFLIKCHFKLVVDENQYMTWIESNLLDEKTMISWKKIYKT